jgi:two-component system NtrC family sensor kinase
MTRQSHKNKTDQIESTAFTEELRSLSRQILQIANSGLTRTHFLRKILNLLIDYFKADSISILIRALNGDSRNELVLYEKNTFRYSFYPRSNNMESQNNVSDELDEYWKHILSGSLGETLSILTEKGSLWIRNMDDPTLDKEVLKQLGIYDNLKKGAFKSLLVTPFLRENERIGLIEFKYHKEYFLSEYKINSIETFINTLGMMFLNQHTQAALQERVKELTCLYSMSQIADKPYVLLEDLIYSIIDFLPPAWQYPEITQVRIILDGIEYSLPHFIPDASKLSADIYIEGRKRGNIEVIYTEERPQLDEGPFLKEERKLLVVVAMELALIIERRESEEDKEKLINQLHHADRLATVGELAAGVAHEINEPLGSILGFAQLASKDEGAPDQVKKDLKKIVSASLHAREIVKKLMTYSRQVNPEKTKINLNQIVEDSLYFCKSRCLKEGIELNLCLGSELPSIIADPVQINQVIVNIVVNAMQSIRDFGKIDIRTLLSDDGVELIISDTGHGMKEEVLQQIFDPFYTTKEAGKGLGLGLSVVNAIIKSHNGKIEVNSEPGKGTEFIIRLPAGDSQETNGGE